MHYLMKKKVGLIHILNYLDASKSNRPLSASRKSTETKIDPHDEAAAVVRALQEENKMVEKSKSRPLPQPKVSSLIHNGYIP